MGKDKILNLIQRLMVYDDKKTLIDEEVNRLLKKASNNEECISFIHDIYSRLKSKASTLVYTERSQQTLLFKEFHSLVTSSKFRENCLQLFDSSPHAALIGFKLATEVRKFVHAEAYYSKSYPSTLFHKGDFTTETESGVRAQTRYVAGWVVSSKRKELISKIRKCPNTAQNNSRQTELKLLESLSRSEGQLDAECVDPSSRQVIQSRQNEKNGLTNVSDKMFAFINAAICSARNTYTLDQVNYHKGNAYHVAFEKVKNTKTLFEMFVTNFTEVPTSLHAESFGDPDTAIVGTLLSDISDVTVGIIGLYEAIINKVMHMVHATNRRLYLDQARHKKVQHRMQIMMSSKSQTGSKSKKCVSTAAKRKSSKQGKRNTKRKRMTMKENDDREEEEEEEEEEGDDDDEENQDVEMEDVTEDEEDELEDNEDCYECGLHDSGKAEDSWIFCDRCHLWYHQECTGYSEAYLRVYVENEGRKWVCRYCARS